MKRIELNTAATSTRHPKEVGDAMLRALSGLGNTGRGADAASVEAARAVEGVREQLAEVFHLTRASKVIFTKNATEALNVALFGLLAPGDAVITSVMEHNSVLRPLYALEKKGVRLDFLSSDEKGNPVLADLPKLFRPETKAVVMTAMSNLTGNVTDLAFVGSFCRSHGLLFVVDGAQAGGCRPINMAQDQIDVLCLTGHKGLMGPQGTGALLIGEGVEIRPCLFGGTGVDSYNHAQPDAYPTRLEAGTLNGVGIAGWGAGLSYLSSVGIEAVQKRESAFLRRFLQGLEKLPGLTTYGDFHGEHGPILSLNLERIDSADLAMLLAEDYGIAVRTGMHCAPLMHEALGTAQTGSVRFSWNYFTKEEEIDAAIHALWEIAEGLHA